MPKYGRRPGNDFFFFTKDSVEQSVVVMTFRAVFNRSNSETNKSFWWMPSIVVHQRDKHARSWLKNTLQTGARWEKVGRSLLNFCLLWFCLCHISFKLNVPLLCHTEVGLFYLLCGSRYLFTSPVWTAHIWLGPPVDLFRLKRMSSM